MPLHFDINHIVGMAPHISLGVAILAALPAVDALVMSNQMVRVYRLWRSGLTR